MKKWFVITIVILFLSVVPLSNIDQSTEAASTQYVIAKNDILLRDAPKKDAKTIAKIKSTSKVVVHSKKGEWAYVEHNEKKGYIYASTLTKKIPPAKTAPVVTNGLMPKVNRSYTYEPSFEGPDKVTYKAQKNSSITNSVELLESDYIGYTYIERKNQLEFGVAYSDVFFFSLSYPMKEKGIILDTDYSYDGGQTTTKISVESTSAKVKTKAGTFKNVVILKYPNGTKLYLAKDYGIIRITDNQGNITTELIAVK